MRGHGGESGRGRECGRGRVHHGVEQGLLGSTRLRRQTHVSYTPTEKNPQPRDVRFDSKSGSDWPQMEQIQDFFRSDFRSFWRTVKKYTDI